MCLGPKSSVFVVLLLTAFLVGGVSGQTTTSGALAGVVIDQTNAVVPDATVEITNTAKGITRSSNTDTDGVYQFFFLTPGSYSLTVSHAGFREQKQSVNVLLGPPVSVNVKLEVAKSTAEIFVTGEAPLIQAENGDVSTSMSQSQVSEVPNPGND